MTRPPRINISTEVDPEREVQEHVGKVHLPEDTEEDSPQEVQRSKGFESKGGIRNER